MPRFAANISWLFTEHAPLDRFEQAARAGFPAVEMLFPYSWPMHELKSRLDENDLQCVLFNCPPGRWDAGERGLAALPGRTRAFRDSVERALEFAAALSCQQLHVMAGIPQEIHDALQVEAQYFENLAWAADLAQTAGVSLLIEPINRIDMPGYFLNVTAQARRFITALNRSNVGLQLDIYHAQITEGHVSSLLKQNFDVIRHIQVSGVPGRNEPDLRQEINYPFLFNIIDKASYEGWIGCEYRPRADTLSGLKWVRPYGLAPREAS